MILLLSLPKDVHGRPSVPQLELDPGPGGGGDGRGRWHRQGAVQGAGRPSVGARHHGVSQPGQSGPGSSINRAGAAGGGAGAGGAGPAVVRFGAPVCPGSAEPSRQGGRADQ